MDNCLAFFDELYAQILSHDRCTVITHTYTSRKVSITMS